MSPLLAHQMLVLALALLTAVHFALSLEPCDYA